MYIRVLTSPTFVTISIGHGLKTCEIGRKLKKIILIKSPSGSVGSASDSYSVGPWIEARLV